VSASIKLLTLLSTFVELQKGKGGHSTSFFDLGIFIIMKLINLLSKIVLEQPSLESKFIRKGLVASEGYDGNIFELYTGKHGVDRSIRPENTSDVTKIDIIDKFKKAIPELNKRFFMFN
jgi:hypothetical protein